MFGDDVLKKQQEAIERIEKESAIEEKKFYKQNLSEATNRMEAAKRFLIEQAESGKDLTVTIKTSISDGCYKILRELGWNEGISVEPIASEGIIYNSKFEIKNFTVKDNLKELLEENYLDYREEEFLDIECEYSISLAEKEDFFDMQNMICQCNGIVAERHLNALVNAAYRNGLEGEIPEFFGISEIKPTIQKFLSHYSRYKDCISINNYMEILHNSSIEKKKIVKK